MKFKSTLEKKFSDQFKLPYETHKLDYISKHTYTPDFTISKYVFIETKGRFTSADRSKIKCVIQQHPEVTLALVFQKPHQTISKSSSTTYAVWCDKHCIQWFDINDLKGIQAFIDRFTKGMTK